MGTPEVPVSQNMSFYTHCSLKRGIARGVVTWPDQGLCPPSFHVLYCRWNASLLPLAGKLPECQMPITPDARTCTRRCWGAGY